MSTKYVLAVLLVILPKLLLADALIVGTNAEFYPFTYIEKGKIEGFDIEVAKEVAKRLGKEIELKDMPFEALIPALCLGDLHIIAAGMSTAPERAKRVLFTKPYITEDPLVILSKKCALTLDDLSGKIVAVNDGFTADLFMSERKKKNANFDLLRLPATQDAFLALKSDRADCFVTAKSTLDAFLEKQKGESYFFTTIAGSSDDCSLAVSKKYPELLIDIQKALDEMIEDGTMATLKAKWKLP